MIIKGTKLTICKLKFFKNKLTLLPGCVEIGSPLLPAPWLRCNKIHYASELNQGKKIV